MKLEYRVKVDMPNLPKGIEIDVEGVGLLKNGSTTAVELDSDVASVLRETPGYEVTTTKGGGS